MDLLTLTPQRSMYDEWNSRQYTFAEKIVAFGNYVFASLKTWEEQPRGDVLPVRVITMIWDGSRDGFEIVEDLIKSKMTAYKLEDVYDYNVKCILMPKDFQTSKDSNAYELRITLYVYQH